MPFNPQLFKVIHHIIKIEKDIIQPYKLTSYPQQHQMTTLHSRKSYSIVTSCAEKIYKTHSHQVNKIIFENQDEGEDDDINLVFHMEKLMKAEEQLMEDVMNIFEISSSM